MKKKIKKISIILLVILISIFVGYEHPGLVEVPKKYVYFLLKKVGLKESALDKTINKEAIKNFNENKIIKKTNKIKTIFLGLLLYLNFTSLGNAETVLSEEGQYIFNSLAFYIGGVLVAFMAAGFCMLESGLVTKAHFSRVGFGLQQY